MAHIVATIGPSSHNPEILEFFAKHGVEIARMNFSHNTPQWHEEAGNLARQHGLKLLFDLPGPKIRLGEFETVEIASKSEIVLEMQTEGQSYPYEKDGKTVLPYQFPVHKFVKTGHPILVDDGKLELEVTEIGDNFVVCKVIFGGTFKSRKGMNMPQSQLEVDFLGERDRLFLNALVAKMRPEYVASSFVKTQADLLELKELISGILQENGVTDYFPKICPKLEMGEAVSDENLPKIVSESDLIMIARGDLALETLPAHVLVPFLQEKIKKECQKQGKPFIVATQVLESMIISPVPTRAEVSDLYRAIHIDKADYVMLSGESAGGMFPTQCVALMEQMIKMHN